MLRVRFLPSRSSASAVAMPSCTPPHRRPFTRAASRHMRDSDRGSGSTPHGRQEARDGARVPVECLESGGKLGPDAIDVDRAVAVRDAIANRHRMSESLGQRGVDDSVPRQDLEALGVRGGDAPTLVAGDVERDVRGLLNGDEQAHGQCILTVDVRSQDFR